MSSPDPETTQLVRTAAERLTEELRAAEQAAGGWENGAVAEPLVHAALNRCLATLVETGLVGPANQIPSRELWSIAGPWLQTGWLQVRAREKPRGYAGDYELFERIVRGTACDDPLGRLFDRYFLSQHAPQAVCRRTEVAARAILETVAEQPDGPVRLLCLGCGPAAELEAALGQLGETERARVFLTLLDLDPAAVEFAAARVSRFLAPEQFEARHANLSRLAARPLAAEAPRYHLAWSLGFFDYLQPEPFTALLRWLAAALAPGGRLMAFNFSPANPTRPYMEWIGNWYLLARSAEALAELAEQAELPGWKIGSEPLGVNLFIEARQR